MTHKDPIFGEPMLTPTERAAEKMQMAEHRKQKCHRCKRRLDLSDLGFVCGAGMDHGVVMRAKTPGCKRFALQDDKTAWLS